jgi:DNA-binding CsgD family transcriptional regulator
MGSASAGRLARIMVQLRQNPGVIGGLPGEERAMAEAALEGASVQEIAQEHGISVEAVWTTLSNVARLAGSTGTARTVEIGGLGSDTDPGIHGGYGDTGFGSLDTDPPYPMPEEPREGADSTPQGRPRS